MAAGTVAYTDPAGSAFPGCRIGLYVSTGVPAFQPPAVQEPPAAQQPPPPSQVAAAAPTAAGGNER